MLERFRPRMVGWPRTTRPVPASQMFAVPADMTDHDRIRELIRWGEAALEAGHREIVVDLTGLETVDSAMLAGLVLLTRRAKPLGAKIRLVGFQERFESLLEIYRLVGALRESGVMMEPSRDGTGSDSEANSQPPLSSSGNDDDDDVAPIT